MPELPEVETTLAVIKPLLLNNRITSIAIYQPKLRWVISEDLQDNLSNSYITKCFRRGKYIVIQTAVGSCLLHLGMSGKLAILPKKTPARLHDHVVFELQNQQIHFNDPRRFGCVLWTNKPLEQHKLITNLGPEPLSNDFNARFLYTKTRKSKAMTKSWLMNSHNVVGVGNIYANEALFYSGISPKRAAGNLSAIECEDLVSHIKAILNKAIKAGGTTLRDFYSPDSSQGYFQQCLAVYGKDGKSCQNCESIIVAERIGQRNSFFCKNCQI